MDIPQAIVIAAALIVVGPVVIFVGVAIFALVLGAVLNTLDS